MAIQNKILISVLVIVVVLIGGFFIYNKLLKPELAISIPSEIEVVAYKPYSFNFSIKNEGKAAAKEINIILSLKETPVVVTPSGVDITSGESKNFEAKLDGLEPGDFNLSLEVKGKHDINIIRAIPIKSELVVGLDAYHPVDSHFWKEEVTPVGLQGEKVKRAPTMKLFLDYINEAGIKTKVIESQFTSEILKDINVLIIAKPDQPILTTEKQVLIDFLRQGNGLLLAGDMNWPGHFVASSINHLNDLTGFLHLELKFNDDYLEPTEWTKDITEHQITSGIEEIIYKGCSLSTEVPAVPLVKYQKKTIYAIQYYAKGKIGAVGNWYVLGGDKNWEEGCRQCQRLHINLIKWLATPPTPEELEELGR